MNPSVVLAVLKSHIPTILKFFLAILFVSLFYSKYVSLQNTIIQLEKENIELNSKLEVSNINNKTLANNILSKNIEINKLQIISLAKENTITELNDRIDIINSTKNSLRNDIARLKDKRINDIKCTADRVSPNTNNGSYLDPDQLEVLNKINTSVINFKLKYNYSEEN